MTQRRVSFLGAGEMGAALVVAAAKAGSPVTVWNRSPRKAQALAAQGITVADSVRQAVGTDVLVVCLFDHRSVHSVLDPVADQLAGVSIVNLTTTAPDGSRELARWAAELGAEYLDGGIMAVPAMIGTPQSQVLYSGSREVFDRHRPLLECWGSAEYFGADAGMAALYDLALLAAMYVMFAGFFHGAAMLGAAGVPAAAFAARAAPWLQAMTGELPGFAAVVDGADYAVPGQQSLLFSDISEIVEASRAQKISTEVVDMVQGLIHRQIDAGHGTDGFARIIEGIRTPAA